MDDWEYYSRLPALGFEGYYTPGVSVFLRTEVSERLSWQGEPERLNQFVAGRMGQLRSLQKNLGSALHNDQRMCRTIAWQYLTIATLAVRRGWQGDDRKLIQLSSEIAPLFLSSFDPEIFPFPE